jgi:hypothetical protein
VRIRDFRGSGTYRARIFRNYLWISLLPASFFVLLGAAAIFISQGFVMDELRGLERKTLGQVSDSIELIFREADSIALSLSTDPELIGSLEYSLSIGIPTLTDLRKARAVQSVFASAGEQPALPPLHLRGHPGPGSGPLLHDLLGGPHSPGRLSRRFLGGGHRRPGGRASRLVGPRNVRLLPGIGYSVPAMTLYRNLVGPGDLSRRGVLAVNVDLRYIDQMIDQGISSLFTETPGGAWCWSTGERARPWREGKRPRRRRPGCWPWPMAEPSNPASPWPSAAAATSRRRWSPSAFPSPTCS